MLPPRVYVPEVPLTCGCGHDETEHVHGKGACRHQACGCFYFQPEGHGARRTGGELPALAVWIEAAADRLEAAGVECERPLHNVFRCQECEACKRSALVLDARRWIGE